MKLSRKLSTVAAVAAVMTVGLTPAAHATSQTPCTYSDNGTYHFCAQITYNSTGNYTSVVLTSLTAPSTTDFSWSVSISSDKGYVWSNQNHNQDIDVFSGYQTLVLRLNEATYGPGSLKLIP